MVRVVVVEDDVLIQMSLIGTLEDAGMDVIGSADEALSAAKLIVTLQPDVVLMDVTLNGPYDGIYAATRVRETMSVPIIFLTAYVDDITRARMDKVHPSAILTKPYEEAHLVATLTRMATALP